jgi:hypothetical protein
MLAAEHRRFLSPVITDGRIPKLAIATIIPVTNRRYPKPRSTGISRLREETSNPQCSQTRIVSGFLKGRPPLSQSGMAPLDIGNAISILTFVVIPVTGAMAKMTC